MPIPQSQLNTWSHQGAVATSATAYNSIKTALGARDSRISTRDYDVFLQGSYRNSTNIFGDSDVDIVVQLNSTFGSDIASLDATQRVQQQNAYALADYPWKDFREDVLQTLEKYYGKQSIHSLNKCIQVVTGPGRITADVVPAIQFRKYDYFYSSLATSYTPGIQFWDSAGNSIVNYPKQHIENGELKNAANRTNGWYKPTVRIFKNARNYLVESNVIGPDVAPSYFVECLVFNAPDDRFGRTYQDTYWSVVNYLWTLKFSLFMCQNGAIPLFGTEHTQWNSDAASVFLAALRNLYLNWH